ncbi:MAG: DUF3180 domain-containing protein [Frankiales bacterium]|nr:DUF3180 domain-containing protein [Frankiales bacterium]
MTPSRPSVLVSLAAGFALLGYLLGVRAYGSLPPLPLLAPFTLAVLAVVELALARLVRQRLRSRLAPGARPMHPLQVARAAVLARASSTAGAVLLGVYAGLLAWVLPRGGELVTTDRDIRVAGVSVALSAALVLAALLLERACRTPDLPRRSD